MADSVQDGQAASSSNSLSSLQKIKVESAGLTAAGTTNGSLAVNLPSTATVTRFLPPTAGPPATAAQCTDQTSLVVYDGLGDAHTINVYFTYTGAGWQLNAYEGTTSVLTTAQLLNFDSAGKLSTTAPVDDPTSTSPASEPLTLTFDGQSMCLDLSKTTQLATGFTVTSATANGSAPATLTGVSIATDGTLSYNYSNGASVAAYEIPLANVASPDNLSSVNGGAYTATAASGPIFIGSAGESLGSIESSSLESSTVDIATELTDMIQAQSAYEANSKVFQTGATLLDVLNNLKS
jgi:flagellar hook protein FlgE